MNVQQDLNIEALKNGDRVEFAKLVDLYSNRIYRLALKITGNEQDAEDVLQMTFIKTLKHIHTFEGRSNLSTWLYRVASNEALMVLRRDKKEISIDQDNEDDSEEVSRPLELADWSALPESEFATVETNEQLNAAIAKLPVKLRSVFVLRDIESLSIRETAEALEITETAVKTRLLRARLQLRERLAEYFSEKTPREAIGERDETQPRSRSH